MIVYLVVLTDIEDFEIRSAHATLEGATAAALATERPASHWFWVGCEPPSYYPFAVKGWTAGSDNTDDNPHGEVYVFQMEVGE